MRGPSIDEINACLAVFVVAVFFSIGVIATVVETVKLAYLPTHGGYTSLGEEN